MVQHPTGRAEQQKKEKNHLMFIVLFLLESFYCGDPKKSQYSDAADFHNCLYDSQHFRQDCVPVSNS